MLAGGIDIGTSGCKIALYNEKGTFCGSVYKEYHVKREKGLHEIDPGEIFAAVKAVLKEADTKDLKVLAVTSFGETFVVTDDKGDPLAPSMLYTDPRGGKECETVLSTFGAKNLAFQTGTKLHPMYSLPKIMWIKNNMPHAFRQAKHIFLMQDYILYKLTGKCMIDYSLAARTACFDIKEKRYMEGVLDFCGISPALLSTPVPSGTVISRILPTLCEELELSKDTLSVVGCHDQIAAMTGAGVFESGEVMDGTGTVECVPVVCDAVPSDFRLYDFGYSVVPHINGKYACYALSYAGGASLKWFKNELMRTSLSYAELDKKVKDTPTNLFIMPHFAGAATPFMDTGSKAAVIGLTFEHTANDIYKALMEGTAFEILLNLEKLSAFGITPKEMIATGGGANSDVWLQVKADVSGIPVKALDNQEIGAAGTAYVAGKAIGMYDENTRLAGVRKEFLPNKEKHAFYAKQFKKYEKIYKAAKEVLKNDE